MMKRLTFLLGLLTGGLVHGQIDLKNRPINLSYGNFGVFSGTSATATSGQFGGVAGLSSSVSKNPDQDDPQPPSSNLTESLPSNGAMLLRQSYLGGSFSGSVPDYFIGDIIPPPDPIFVDHDADPATPEIEVIFQAEPVIIVKPGKVDHDDDPLTPDIPNPPPPDPPVVADGFLAVTDDAPEADAALFAFPSGYNEGFYWSKHAEKVFASDSGRMTIYWRSQTRIREQAGNVFLVKAKSYAVSAGASKTPQEIYWTESRFNGPPIKIPVGVVQEVVVVYNKQIEECIPEEEIYRPEGGTGLGNIEIPLPNQTLWYDFDQGMLRSYNKEGRVLVEYLGQPRDPADSTVREHLGFEVVDVIRERAPVKLDLYLGERMLPSDGALAESEKAGPDGKRLFDAQLYSAWHVNAGANDEFVRRHSVKGKHAYYAVGKNESANEVQIYWLLPSPEGGLGVEWTSEFNSYLIDWPKEIDDFFALNARPANDSLVRPTAFPLPPETAPVLVFQDDETAEEASINLTAELEIDFLPNSDDANRALLLLSAPDGFWYMRVYSYLEDNVDDLRSLTRPPLVAAVSDAQSALEADSENNVLRNALAAAESLLYRYDNFRKYHVEGTVAVGERIEAPGGADSPAGYISAGDGHNPSAYISPLASVPAAEAGAIIPVNARPGHDTFSIWWYKKISPPSDSFDPIYVPSIVGEYTVVWPGEAGTQDVSEIVLAENKGTGDLPPSQQGAELYAQNSPSLPGYNPNEEHALKLASRFYALRDDLNVSDANGVVVSSKPYVLIEYTDPDDGRPSMRAFRVLREKDVNGDDDLLDPGDITFRYNAIAPVGLQGPSPLSVMPVPALADGSSANEEVTPSDLDPALNIPDGGLPGRDPSTGQADLSQYNRFTYKDRNGLSWVYRGPHDPTAGVFGDGDLSNDPAIGMQFYYNTLEGFDFPDADGNDAAPAIGTIVPYLRPYATAGDPDSGFDPANDPKSAQGTPLTIEFVPLWPDDPRLPDEAPEGAPEFVQKSVPELRFAETQTVTKSSNELPEIRPNSSIEILYQQSIARDVTAGVESAVLYDPERQKRYEMGPGDIPPAIATVNSRGKTFFQLLPPHLQDRFFFDPLVGEEGALILEGSFEEEIALDDFLLPNVLSSDDVTTLKDLVPTGDPKEGAWDGAIDALTTTMETFRPDPEVPGTYTADANLDRSILGTGLAKIVDSDTAVASYALTAVGGGSGYVSMIFGEGKAFTPEGEPVAVKIFKVGGGLYQGQVKPITPDNPLSEQVSLQHTGDFAGKAPEYEFEWSYTPPVNGAKPDLPGITVSSPWLPLGTPAAGKNRNVFGGGAQPLLTLSDNYVTMRYRPVFPQALSDQQRLIDNGQATLVDPSTQVPLVTALTDAQLDIEWSAWTEPALVEGWIKRVLAGINPFSQRLGDFFNNAVDTNISLLTQAGTRWEGDVALTLDNMADVGLIELYETVLNRGKSFSIDGAPPVDYGPANDALLLAAGYLADLYQIVGDDAFADAANPMVLFDTQSIPLVADSSVSQGFSEFFRETATSRFAFEGQVASLLEEETILLRGRDDRLSTGIENRPFYNRLPWNYTRGIDAGEVVYALNYNIRERQEAEADGVIDAVDAARQYPMGHGDAYGHYLMVLKNYYGLLTDPHFSWAPRIEAVNILGVPVSVDYFDERKFAQAAVSLGRTANQVIGLERRETYREDASKGWGHLRDNSSAESPRIDPAWGVDGWAARSAQGGYFHWIVSNALLPEEDTVNEGIQKIDRTTVPELDELAMQADEFQRQTDEANLFVNPLGLTANSILFDISPAALAEGQTHYEQIYERAVRSLDNAWEVFDRARESTQLLRALENQSEDFSTAVFDEERSFTSQLREIFGQPYPGDIGPGKFYPQGYEGPDLLRYIYIDVPYHFEDPTAADSITFNLVIPGATNQFTRTYNPSNSNEIPSTLTVPEDVARPYTLQPNTIAQFATSDMGQRAVTGELQDALLEMAVARTNLKAIATDHDRLRVDFDRKLEVFEETVEAYNSSQAEFGETRKKIREIQLAIAGLRASARASTAVSNITRFISHGLADVAPRVVGFSYDVGFAHRGLTYALAGPTVAAAEFASAGFNQGADNTEPDATVARFNFNQKLAELGFGPERTRMVWELEQAFDVAFLHQTEVDLAVRQLVQASQRYQTLLSKGLRLQTSREIFRKRAAVIAQGYRTRDVAFRTFRTEALEQYQGLLDWAARYAYSTAKAYDYETGLLGGEAGQDFLNRIVRTRSLGLVSESGEPQFAGADTGDPGLSGLLKKLDGDWSVANGRLGFNNPDSNGTTFSLRRENYRLPAIGVDDRGWTSRLKESFVPDLRTDADVAAHALQIEGGEAPIPGIILSFSTQVRDGVNFFGQPLMAGDHVFSPTAFATKIRSVGVVLKGYKGMDPCLTCTFSGPGDVTTDHEDALSATPYVYLIPVGQDVMRTPPLGDGSGLRSWQVHDHALPLPFNIGDSAFSDIEYWTGAETLSEPFFQPRKHQAFRAVDNPEFFSSDHPEDFTNSRLVSRSVWNTNWKLVIPGQALLADPIEGLDRLMRSVTDVQLYLKTYSYAGN